VRAEAERVRLAVEITIEEGWHLYHDDKGPPDAVGRPTSIVPGPPEGIIWGRPIFPEPKRLEQPGVGAGGRDTWIWGHEGTIVVHVEGRVAAGVDGQGVWVDIDGQTCQDNGSCIPWSTHVISGGEGPDSAFENFPAEAASTIGTADTPSDAWMPADGGVLDWDAVSYPTYQPRGASEQRSLALWLCFAFIAGVLLNVMPCVLPVVSIKILSFVQQAGESRARIFQLGLAFSAGILAVFVALAALAALGNKGWGAQFQSQTFLIVMIAIVFAFALSLFDVFEVGVPQQVGQLAAQRREGVGDAFFKGMMATAVPSCASPWPGP
jgi:thiol:disulfide interchange protein